MMPIFSSKNDQIKSLLNCLEAISDRLFKIWTSNPAILIIIYVSMGFYSLFVNLP